MFRRRWFAAFHWDSSSSETIARSSRLSAGVKSDFSFFAGCQACIRCQRVSGNSTLLAHRRAFPFRAVPIAPFESRPFLRPLGEHRVAPQCFVPSVRSPLQATDASHGGKMSSFGWALPLLSLYVNDGVAGRQSRVTFPITAQKRGYRKLASTLAMQKWFGVPNH